MLLHVILFLLFLLIWIPVFYLLNLIIVKRLSYSLNERYLHFRYIIAGFLLTISAANSFASPYIILLVDKIINFPVISKLINLFIPARAYELIYIILCMLGMNLIYSVAFIVVFLAVRLTFLKRKKFVEYESLEGWNRVWGFPWFVVGLYYHNEDGKITLSNKGHSIGIWVRAMKYASIVLWVLEFAVLYFAILWGRGPFVDLMLAIAKAAYLLPMALFLIFEQIQLFLEGPVESDEPSFGTVKISEKMVGNLNALMAEYLDVFSESDMLLFAEQGKSNVPEAQGLQGNDLGNQQETDCDEEAVLKVIATNLRNSKVNQNYNYQNAIIELLNGNAVFIRDFFDGEFTVYLCAYLNHYLCGGKSAVFLCESSEKVENVIGAIERKNHILKGMNDTWKIRRAKDIVPNMVSIGVLVCTFDEFLNLEMSSQFKKAYEDFFCVVFPDSMECMQQDALRLELIFGRIVAMSGINRYVFYSSDDNESLRGLITTFLPDSMRLIIYKNDSRKKNTGIMVWKEESIYHPQSILNLGEKSSPYLGTALPLAFVAIKNDFLKVYVAPGERRPNLAYKDAANNNNLIHQYFNREIGLNSIIRNDISEAIEEEDKKVLVVYDDEYNLFSALWKWFKYAGKDQTIIHVVSPSYLFREYFAANFSLDESALLYENNKYKALFPKECVLNNTNLLLLLSFVCDHDLSVDEVMDYSKRYGWDYKDIREVLRATLVTIRSASEVHKIYDHFVFDMKKHFEINPARMEKTTTVYLEDKRIVEELKNKVSYAKINDTEHTFELGVLKGNILNYYLEGQMIVHNDYSLKITGIDYETGVVYAIPRSTILLYDYHYISNFIIRNRKVLDDCVDSPYIDFTLSSATVKRNYLGYISSINGNDFSEAGLAEVADISTKQLSCEMAEVPILEIKIRKNCVENVIASVGGDTRGILYLLSVLLNGFFKTLFPKTFPNIIAVPEWETDEKLIRNAMDGTHKSSIDDLVYLTIPQIIESDAELSDEYVRLYIIEFSCLEYGMVKTVYEARMQIFRVICEYLEWYVSSNKPTDDDSANADKVVPKINRGKIIRGTYLNYGGDKISSLFSDIALFEVLNTILARVKNEKTAESYSIHFDYDMMGTEKVSCSFCNRRIAFAYKLSDGRFMCSHCHDHQTSQKNEINKLFIETQKQMEEHYSIRFRKDISVRFQTADAIKKVAGDGYSGRVVGFYRHDKHDLWIESKGPKVAMRSTIIHELTHSWQYDNLPLKELGKTFSRAERDKRIKLLLEGHAVFVELEAMSELGEIEYVKRMREDYERRNDEYGEGYLMIAGYINSKKEMGSHITSFKAMEMLVDALIKKEEVLEWPKDS